ncbi:hypothetical protein NC652_015139 [Populus alba x Populus x berolinensis]|nr:hypothetical protein NC652_015139 [Populus alba x Populus x berolinensis]
MIEKYMIKEYWTTFFTVKFVFSKLLTHFIFQYYYFIRLMGRKASHVALECTLQSHPNMVILGEEVAASKLTLFDLTAQICDAVQARAAQGFRQSKSLYIQFRDKLQYWSSDMVNCTRQESWSHSTARGLIESIPEVYALLKEIHDLLRHGVAPDKISSQLSPWTSALFEFLPPYIKKQLLLHPESDDSAQLSQIETEKLLAHLVETEKNKRLLFTGVFGVLSRKKAHTRGKSSMLSATFLVTRPAGLYHRNLIVTMPMFLGTSANHILAAGLNGYKATVTNLKNPVNKWRCGAAPITVAETECRKVFGWMTCTEIQVRNIVKPGCSQEVLKAALSVMASVTDVLSVMSSTSSNGQTPL